MQITVNLQEPFSYSIYPIVIVSFFIIILLIIIISIKLHNSKKQLKSAPIQKKLNTTDINRLKEKYIKLLDDIENKMQNEKISLRVAYQRLSTTIRYFVFEITNIKVQNCTLDDIKKLNMPQLYELIEEYYTPEFAKKSIGDIKSSIEKARKVIEKWS